VVVLPPQCDLPVPRLPRGRDWTREERALWRQVWTSPQASQYDDSYAPTVAANVAHCSAILAGSAAAWQAQEFRRLGDALGLTPAGLRALGWVLPYAAPAPVVPLRGRVMASRRQLRAGAATSSAIPARIARFDPDDWPPAPGEREPVTGDGAPQFYAHRRWRNAQRQFAAGVEMTLAELWAVIERAGRAGRH
jgi:hypothetical protein